MRTANHFSLLAGQTGHLRFRKLLLLLAMPLLIALLLVLTGCSPLADPFDQEDPRIELTGKDVDQNQTASSSSFVPLEWFLANSSNISQQSGIPEPELMDLFLAGRVTVSSDTLEIARQNCTDCNGLVEITLEDLH